MIDPQAALTLENTVLVTDTGSDLAIDHSPSVRVCPLAINFGNETFAAGVELSDEEFYRRLTTTDVTPTTAQPSVAEMAQVYREALDDHEFVVALHLSERLSGTTEAARSAAKEVDERRIAVIPTGQVACSLGLLIMRAEARLARGTTMRELTELVDHFRSSCATVFTVETLEFLQRGGRIGRAQYMAGSLLRVRPILSIEDGEVSPIAKVRGQHKVIPALGAALAERTPDDVPLRAAITHADRPEMVAPLIEMVREIRPNATIEFDYQLGPTLGVHGGPGTIGVTLAHDPDDR